MEPEEKKYVPLFYLMTIVDGPGFDFNLSPIEEILEPEMAEVCIPYHTEDTIYALTFYITNYANYRPCLTEMILLDQFVKEMGVPQFEEKS